jgi:hypothetical protein
MGLAELAVTADAGIQEWTFGVDCSQKSTKLCKGLADGDVAPIQSIGGAKTEVETPVGIAVH